MNVHKMFRRRLLNVLCTFNLHPVPGDCCNGFFFCIFPYFKENSFQEQAHLGVFDFLFGTD